MSIAIKTEFHDAIRKIPATALRLGYLDEKNAQWRIKDKQKQKDLIKGLSIELIDSDINFHAAQKGVDMKIGLDIATLTLKNHVDKIVLIAGDSDFVPAAKLARIEGVSFTLDAMYKTIRSDLSEHIDYLRTRLPKDRESFLNSKHWYADNSENNTPIY